MNPLILAWILSEILLIGMLVIFYQLYNYEDMRNIFCNHYLFLKHANIFIKIVLLLLFVTVSYGITSFICNAFEHNWSIPLFTEWGTATDSIITIATLITTTVTIYLSLYFNWENTLPKRISVVFLFEINKVLKDKLNNEINNEIDKITTKNQNGYSIDKIYAIKEKLNNLLLDNNKYFFEINQLKEEKQEIENKKNKFEKIKDSLNLFNDDEQKIYLIYGCFDAELASEADRRQWAQQIGRQMNEGKDLVFYPYFDMSKGEIKIINKELVRNYLVTMYLKYPPSPNSSGDIMGKVWLENTSNTIANEIKEFEIKSFHIKNNHKNDYEYLKNKAINDI